MGYLTSKLCFLVLMFMDMILIKITKEHVAICKGLEGCGHDLS